MSDQLQTLRALAARLDDVEAVSGAAVHDEPRPWVEVVVECPLLGPAVLREIADHNCGISEATGATAYVMATAREVGH